MYLPTFYKLFHETNAFRLKRYVGYGPLLLTWSIWTLYPALYNMIYSDFIPPERGVPKRIVDA
ncbi:transmembrane protein, putative (macronuclear) [Tetrahymena thermophila SB210]|uniref:Transmembrane protein, putative n=1 Tax=Tetrahymena thermophila (strain SB210) TaxID=312017 RepID=I7MFL6_TETTS|nr:transmembrane protein, putative [Tetrahymena thermophila SB210]7TGH_3J Chain 3J, Transmembrane protein, putative [Tetrahymena thermophila]7TGH_3j Chain 3j, Transmembrane protein, putative [Tetrahymena thermophila]8B6J_K Chain K, Transmembrane protein, putative [Tetrahymena thermophila SB210]8B6J_k Chain k, Transmembrane protein, putative [Tetrahymena thermophila SB210]8BQS_K Chain K, Transmembrane protein, putative [Tetrahymena thermophila SB210]8BQS_k Chain k, Transmembrane protein, putat|eukprot:XP_001020565.1 transmembrane protein, putative [Tetrahymena thermophila SB210]